MPKKDASVFGRGTPLRTWVRVRVRVRVRIRVRVRVRVRVRFRVRVAHVCLLPQHHLRPHAALR